jgi:transposase InsO family protein
MRVHGSLVAFCPSASFFTDHLNLLTARDLEHAYVKRWLVELYQFPCFRALTHLPGRCNVLADFLSRWCVSEQDEAPVGATPSPATDDPSEAPWAKARRRGSAVARGDDLPPAAALRDESQGLLPVRATRVQAQQPGLQPAPAPAPAPVGAVTAADTRPVRRKARSGSPAAGEPEYFSNPHSSQYSPLVTSILEAQWGLSATELSSLRAIPNVEAGILDGRDCLMHRGRLVIPSNVPQLVATVLDLLHDSMLHAHTSKMLAALAAAGLYLPNARKIFEHYCATCPDCQRAAVPDNVPPYRARLLIHPRVAPWEHVFLDYATLPATGAGGPSKLIIMLDAATRYCLLVPTATEDGASSAAALRQWCEHYPPVKAVHTDGGPAFKGLFLDYCSKHSIIVDRGTAYNSKGRGLVERLVKKTKDALRRLVPPGRPEQWLSHVGDLQCLLNRMPHKALGGLSPQQVAMAGTQPFLPHLFAGKVWEPDSQSWLDVPEALRYLRKITEIAGEVSEVKQKIAYDAAVAAPAPYKLGDWCLIYHNERLSSLDSFFRGPFRVTDVQLDEQGHPSGFYTVAAILANDTVSKDTLEVHAARMWPFNGERTSSCAEHWKRLPEGFGVVQEILNHRLHARGAQVLVRYYMVPRPTWEFTTGMREPNLGWNAIFKAYCETHSLPLEGGPQWHNAREDRNGPA